MWPRRWCYLVNFLRGLFSCHLFASVRATVKCLVVMYRSALGSWLKSLFLFVLWVHLIPYLLTLLMTLPTLFTVMAPFTLLGLWFLLFTVAIYLPAHRSWLSYHSWVWLLLYSGSVYGDPAGRWFRDPPRLWELECLLLPSTSTWCESSSTNDATTFVATISISLYIHRYRYFIVWLVVSKNQFDVIYPLSSLSI